MVENLKPLIVSLGVYPYSGGPTKTIGIFKKALEARHFAFCRYREITRSRLAVEGAEEVRSVKFPGFAAFCYASPKQRSQAYDALRVCSVLSCHSFYRYHSLWVERECRRHHVPYWFVPHGILDPWVMEYGRLPKKLFWKLGGQRFLDNACTVIFSTKAERDKASSQFELPGSEVIPWPVELVRVDQRDSARSQIRRKLDIPEEAKVLLYFGRVHSMKRPLETIRALASVGNRDLHLVMVGNERDVSLEDCRSLAATLKLDQQVHLVGPVYGDAKYDYMHAADAYISLSHRENFNHTAAESLAAGLPVMLSPGNDLNSELVGIDCSWRIKDGSIDAAAEAMQQLIECDSSRSRQMGANGRTWVEQNLGFDLFQKRLIELAERYGRR